MSTDSDLMIGRIVANKNITAKTVQALSVSNNNNNNTV
jgi:hypothetical protein